MLFNASQCRTCKTSLMLKIRAEFQVHLCRGRDVWDINGGLWGANAPTDCNWAICETADSPDTDENLFFFFFAYLHEHTHWVFLWQRPVWNQLPVDPQTASECVFIQLLSHTDDNVEWIIWGFSAEQRRDDSSNSRFWLDLIFRSGF